MKKLQLTFIMLVLSISSSFAYQQTFSWGSMGTSQVNINAVCSYFTVDVSFYDSNGQYSSGSFVAAYPTSSSTETLIGEYYYNGYNSPNYTNTVYTNEYCGTVYVYYSASGCHGQATLKWY